MSIYTNIMEDAFPEEVIMTLKEIVRDKYTKDKMETHIKNYRNIKISLT